MIISFGSINVDYVYRLKRMPVLGETLKVPTCQRFLGGKGFNQSVAIARAGGKVVHVGAIGGNDNWILQEMLAAGISHQWIAQLQMPSGHAIIFVDDNGDNQIVVHAGANGALSRTQIDRVLMAVGKAASWVVVQNETNQVEYCVRAARQAGVRVAYSAAPFEAKQALALLGQIDLLAINKTESEALCHTAGKPLNALGVKLILLTKGTKGAELISQQGRFFQPIFAVNAIDTTGAGDSFLGSFIAHYGGIADASTALRYAAAASALQVTRKGAAVAIPNKAEVMTFLKERTACQ